ncbi:MAG: efflux RND transporter permease subunit [Gammaproteobacteria bacterium]|nr:efflux RND transporter permease subunit [Gammaproteobacteria bacterium]
MAQPSTQKLITTATGGIAAWSIRHPVGIIMITLAIMVLGLFSLDRLPVNLLPNIIYPDIRVSISNPGVPAKIMEDQVTRQLEEQLAITEDVISIESTSAEGRSRVNLSFQYGKDIDIALRDASTRLDRAKRFLPEGIEQPIIYKRDPSQRPVAEYIISSSTRDSIALRDWVDEVFSKWFINLPGVAAAEVGGGLIREIRVLPDQQRLAGLGLTTDDIIDAIKKGNQEQSAGRIKLERRELSGRISARLGSIEDIGNLPISLRDDEYIYLKDIATILDTNEDEKLRIRLNGISGIKVSIQKQPNANTVSVVDTIKQRLSELQAQRVLPDDIRVNIVGDQSVYIRHSLNSAAIATISGALLAMIVVYLFLGNLMRTLIIGSAIPIAITATFLLMDLGGLTLNIMTLGGLAVGVGMLVDSTIVMLENIYRHQKEGENSFDAGMHAAQEVNSAIVASTSTNLAAIVPFLFISGLVGLFFHELIFTITAAIITSMIVALTLVPALATRLPQPDSSASMSSIDKLITKLQLAYKRSIKVILVNRSLKFIFFLSLIIAGAVSTPSFNSDSQVFLPKTDDGRIGIRIKADPGVKLNVTDQAILNIEKMLKDMPDIDTVFTIAGGFIFGRTEIEARHYGRIDIQLKQKKYRQLGSDEWITKLNQRLQKNKTPGVRVRVYKLGIPGARFHGGNDDISLRVSGQDLDTLDKIGDNIVRILKSVKGIRNITHSSEETSQELSIKIDRERAINTGLTTEQISRIIKTAISGLVVSDYIDGDRAYNIRVKLPDIDTSNLSNLESLLLGKVKNTNAPVYLGDIASIELIETPAKILRDSQRRIIEINASIAEGYVAGSVLTNAQSALSEINMPDGYQLYDAGISKTLKASQNTVWKLLAIALFLVLVVMAVQYESLINPLIILCSVPFSAIGVAIAINWAELPLSMPLWLGMIMLAGIVVNNAIVMVEYIEILRHKGMSLDKSIAEAAKLRLRPILMTSLTTIIGLTPLAIGYGEGSEMLQPLAITIIGGLSFSLIISLYLIPVSYRALHSRLALDKT